jgi:hypothetical protein
LCRSYENIYQIIITTPSQHAVGMRVQLGNIVVMRIISLTGNEKENCTIFGAPCAPGRDPMAALPPPLLK